MTESEFYQKMMKPWLKKKGFYFFRVEHERMPDIYTAKSGEVIWMELKVLNKQRKDGTVKPDWRPGQLAWIKEHSKLGGNLTLLCLWYIDSWFLLPPKAEYHEYELKGLQGGKLLTN